MPVLVVDEIYFVCLNCEQPVDAFDNGRLALADPFFLELVQALQEISFNLLWSKPVAVRSKVLDCKDYIRKTHLEMA